MFRHSAVLAALVLVGCGSKSEGTDAGSPPDVGAGAVDAWDPCSTNPDCTVCGCGSSTYCCTEGACALQCVARKASGSTCSSDGECLSGECGLAEVGDMRCLVAELEPCTEENCASCDEYVRSNGTVASLCTRSCTTSSECSDFNCVGTGCTSCVRNACRVTCGGVRTCSTDYYCADDGVCVPYDR